jgi:succinate-acetate transporter protein
MSVSETTTTTPTAPAHDGETAAFEEEVVSVGPLAGNPMLLGLPVFVAASVALGLTLVGYVAPSGQAGALPIIMMSTGIGLLITTIWAIALGQSAVACVFGIFSGFWLSYAALLLGLAHNWFGVPTGQVRHTVAAFLITWLVIIGLLTLAMLRLPLAFTVVNVLIDIALALVLIGTIRTSRDWTKAGGWVAFAFAAVGAYIFVGVSSVATGGKPLPVGKPVID